MISEKWQDLTVKSKSIPEYNLKRNVKLDLNDLREIH